jgi:hypothetical protein
MEDGDSDAIHSGLWPARGTDFLDDVDPNVTRESGIGSPVSPFWGGFPDSRCPIGRESGIGNRAVSRSAGTGNRGPRRGRHAGPGISWSSISWVRHCQSATVMVTVRGASHCT